MTTPHASIYGSLYLVRNRRNGKVYIGQTVQGLATRWKRHVCKAAEGSKVCLHAAIRKHGADAFDVVTLHHAFSKDELDEMERRAIWSHQSTDPDLGYNMTNGGSNGKPNAQARQKIGDHFRGKPLSEEHKRKVSKAKRGIPLTKRHPELLGHGKVNSMTAAREARGQRGRAQWVSLTEEQRKQHGQRVRAWWASQRDK